MLSGQDIVMIVFGIAFCFMGYSMFREMMPLWGFLLGGWIAYTLLPAVVHGPQAHELLFQVIAFGVGGVIGAIISFPLYLGIVFLTGAALGMLMGILVGAFIDTGGFTSFRQITAFTAMSFPPLPQTGMQYFLMVVFGLVLGGIAIPFQKFMVCASSAFLGSAAMITGLGGPISLVSSSDMGRGAVMMVGWLILGLVGLFVQFRMLGEV